MSSAPPTRLSICLFDKIHPTPSEKLFEKYSGTGEGIIGGIGGMVPRDFFLVGSREDPRSTSALRLIDNEKIIFNDEKDRQEYFTLRHSTRGLVSVERETAGSELLVSLGPVPYFDGDHVNARPRSIIGVVENPVSLSKYRQIF